MAATNAEIKKYRRLRRLGKIVDEIIRINESCADKDITVDDIKQFNKKIVRTKDLSTIYLIMYLCVLADRQTLRKRIVLSRDPVFSYLTAKNIPYYTLTDSGLTTNKSFKLEDRFKDNNHLINHAHNTEYDDVIGENNSDPEYNINVRNAIDAKGFFVDYSTTNLSIFNNSDLQRNVINYGAPILWAKYARDVHDANVELLRKWLCVVTMKKLKEYLLKRLIIRLKKKNH